VHSKLQFKHSFAKKYSHNEGPQHKKSILEHYYTRKMRASPTVKNFLHVLVQIVAYTNH